MLGFVLFLIVLGTLSGSFGGYLVYMAADRHFESSIHICGDMPDAP
jgi:hypothetical protein